MFHGEKILLGFCLPLLFLINKIDKNLPFLPEILGIQAIRITKNINETMLHHQIYPHILTDLPITSLKILLILDHDDINNCTGLN